MVLPENDVQDEHEYEHENPEHEWALVSDRLVSRLRGVSEDTSPVNSASDFFCRVISETRIVTTKQVVQAKIAVQKFLRHLARIGSQHVAEPSALDQGKRAGWLGQSMMNGRGQDSAEQPDKRAVPGGASPEHAEQERGEERRVHEREHQLEQVHDVVEVRGEISRADADHDSDHRGSATHPQAESSRSSGVGYVPGRCRRSRPC
mgnify:CR=1 FL=1